MYFCGRSLEDMVPEVLEQGDIESTPEKVCRAKRFGITCGDQSDAAEKLNILCNYLQR